MCIVQYYLDILFSIFNIVSSHIEIEFSISLIFSVYLLILKNSQLVVLNA